MPIFRLRNLDARSKLDRKRKPLNSSFARTLGNYALLSAKEEMAYSRIINAAVMRIAKAKSRKRIVWGRFGKNFLKYFLRRMRSNERRIFMEMVLRNLRLAVSVAVRYDYYFFEIEDLVGYGVKGLMIAVLRYDPGKGNKFSTYATHWIRHAICRSCEQYASLVRVPVHELRERSKLLVASSKFEQSLGRKPDEKEISVLTGQSPKAVKKRIANIREVVSLDAPAVWDENPQGASGMMSFQDIIPGEHYGSSHEAVEYRMDSVRLKEAMQKVLSEKERVLLKLRFWDGITLEAVANYPSMVALERRGRALCRERIRQLQEGALEKLRDELAGSRTF